MDKHCGNITNSSSGITQLKADGVPQSELILGQSDAKDGQEILSENFPGGSGSPAEIVLNQSSIESAAKVLDATEGVDGVAALATNDPGFVPLGERANEIRSDIKDKVKKERPKQAQTGMPSVEELVDKAYPFKQKDIKTIEQRVVLQATLSDAPDSDEAKDTIQRMRSNVKQVDESAVVGGPTAIQLDTNTASIRDRQVIIPIVLVAITLILMVLLRSILAPVLLLATTVLSFAATLGVAAILFNGVFGFPGADPSVVLYSFVFLVALGIDYNIFLMTRVREEALKHGTQKGVIKGLVVTGGVITSAGVVLAATFAALGVIPILFLFQLAFIVAFGVLLDTTIVRSLLVPALIKDSGSVVWWPSKLKDKK